MLLRVKIARKIISSQPLLKDLELSLHDKEKVGIIGRNGCGKTTLFRIINGRDNDYDGEVDIKKNAILVTTEQEFKTSDLDKSTIEYILSGLPRYTELKVIIDTYPEKMEGKMSMINHYSSALEEFNRLDYFNAEGNALMFLDKYQITNEMAKGKFKNLSGGQKRFVELVRIQLSSPDIALIDEPTNHMDSIAKSAFIDWLNSVDFSVVIISHDRDVLDNVDKIIEIKDLKAHAYKGNYNDYLTQNTSSTSSALQNYEIAERTIIKLKERIEYAKSKAPSYRGSAKKNPWIVLKNRLEKQLVKIQAENPKPSFWIDKESTNELNDKLKESYHKYKSKNIKLATGSNQELSSLLIECDSIVVGYDNSPLISPVSFKLSHGDRLHIIGRNGVGKTTLVKAIQAIFDGQTTKTLIDGQINLSKKLRLSFYEQEVGHDLLELELGTAIESILHKSNKPVNQQSVMKILSDYLFDPIEDKNKKVLNLSGGQKARLQIIRMLSSDPNLLILDEPTNHLDLPSIEELETALAGYHGAIIYISHDSYFKRNMGGAELKLQALNG